MLGIHKFYRQVHTLSREYGPSETLKRKVAELKVKRKRKDPRKNQLFVQVPDSRSFLDTATMPMILTVVGTALFAKLLMMYDDSKSQDMIERKIKNAPAGQGTVRMLTREEWESVQEVRPRTPFESKLARPNAKLRTGEPLKMSFITGSWVFLPQHSYRDLSIKEDVKDWTIDVITDALTRAEECAKRGSN
ncbi:uncharacterized protein [Solanum lycopersicum]|uniref:uncharacterized protein isoform X2 n=1 Tax=Solanum lycopersicum TaxID=4081 RepID=UPI000E1C5190|nr:uncharacterized protein LOC101264647 isoform X2 [Solanum lycopersicum]